MPRNPDVSHAELAGMIWEEFVTRGGQMPSNRDIQEVLRAKERSASNGVIAAALQAFRERWEAMQKLALDQAGGEGNPVPESVERGMNTVLALVAGEIAEVRAQGHRLADEQVDARRREAETIAGGLRQELEQCREHGDEVATRAAMLEAERGEDAQRIEELKRELAERDEQLGEARTRLDQERASHAAERAASEQERRELEHQVAKLIDRPEEVRAEFAAKVERLEGMIEERERQRAAAEDRAHAEREQERKEQAKLRQMLDREMSELREERATTARLREENAALGEELKEARAALAAATAAVEDDVEVVR